MFDITKRKPTIKIIQENDNVFMWEFSRRTKKPRKGRTRKKIFRIPVETEESYTSRKHMVCKPIGETLKYKIRAITQHKRNFKQWSLVHLVKYNDNFYMRTQGGLLLFGFAVVGTGFYSLTSKPYTYYKLTKKETAHVMRHLLINRTQSIIDDNTKETEENNEKNQNSKIPTHTQTQNRMGMAPFSVSGTRTGRVRVR